MVGQGSIQEVVQNLIDELCVLWDWLRAIQPIRVRICSAEVAMEPERLLLTDHMDQLEHIEVWGTRSEPTAEGADAAQEPQDLSRSDVVLFLADKSGSSTASSEAFSDFAHLMDEVAQAQQSRKHSLAYSLVRPFPDDDALLPYWEGDLDSLNEMRSQTRVDPDGPIDITSGVLKDRQRRLFRKVWKGEIKTVNQLKLRLVREISRAATRLQWLRLGRRFLGASALLGLSGWLVVRYQLVGIILVVAVAGGIYLWTLDRRWSESGI